jgi:hypothetical protein
LSRAGIDLFADHLDTGERYEDRLEGDDFGQYLVHCRSEGLLKLAPILQIALCQVKGGRRLYDVGFGRNNEEEDEQDHRDRGYVFHGTPRVVG